MTKNLILYSYAENVFTEQELSYINNIVYNYNKNNINDGVALNNEKEEFRKTDIKWIDFDYNTKWIYDKLYNVATDLNNRYFNFEINQLEHFQYCTYKEGHYFKKHVDNVSIPNQGQRKLTIILQLSDEKDYGGGELRLHGSDTPFVISKKKGTVVIFPSYVLHDVTPITKGERKVLVSWVLGKNNLR